MDWCSDTKNILISKALTVQKCDKSLISIDEENKTKICSTKSFKITIDIITNDQKFNWITQNFFNVMQRRQQTRYKLTYNEKFKVANITPLQICNKEKYKEKVSTYKIAIQYKLASNHYF